MARTRTRSQFVSCLFEVVYVNGIPMIQNAHIRVLGTRLDVRMDGDTSIADLSLMDCFNAVEEVNDHGA